MSIFQTVSDTFAGIFSRNKKTDPVDKNDVLSLIENNMVVLQLVVGTYEDNPDMFKFVQSELIPANGSNKDNAAASALYVSYVRGLNATARQQETSNVLRSLYAAAKFVLADHEKMRDQFVTLFNDGTSVGDIAADQMKLSHAALFGFINLSSLMCDWYCYFLGMLSGQAGDNPRVPAYRVNMITGSSGTVADFVNDVLVRGASRTIISVVQNIRKEGDVALYVGATSLDTYANINDYPGLGRLMGAFNVLQPILWVREKFTLWAHGRYKRNLMMRDWMLAKIMILRMDMQKVDPASPEYQHQQQILQKYSDELAKLDQKISTYEKA